jgi:hypothetical protein
VIDTFSEYEAQNAVLVTVEQEGGGTIIVNRSLGSSDGDAAASGAADWIDKVTRLGLEDRFLHFTAAGNIGQPGSPPGNDAVFDDFINAAGLFGGIDDDDNFVAPLTNIVVVENRESDFERVASGSFGVVFVPKCLSTSSKIGGQLSAIGTNNIGALVGPQGPAEEIGDGGTSSASPQAAGLAAYLLAIQPGLGVQALKQILLETAQDVEGCGGAPVIDAYAAVLALDTGVAPAAAPVRMAILDVSDSSGLPETSDGVFDMSDLETFLSVFESSDSENPDWSRFDLNGDGFTGHPDLTQRVDLDASGGYGLTPLVVHGTEVPVEEGEVTDLDVLCYYAYSPLYDGGDEVARALQMGLRCGAVPELRVFQLTDEGEAPLPESVESGESFVLEVEVSLPADDGSPIGLEGLDLRFQSTGGTLAGVTNVVLTTRSGGFADTGVEADDDASELVVQIDLLDPEDAPEIPNEERTVLASQTVTIPVTGSENDELACFRDLGLTVSGPTDGSALLTRITTRDTATTNEAPFVAPYSREDVELRGAVAQARASMGCNGDVAKVEVYAFSRMPWPSSNCYPENLRNATGLTRLTVTASRPVSLVADVGGEGTFGSATVEVNDRRISGGVSWIPDYWRWNSYRGTTSGEISISARASRGCASYWDHGQGRGVLYIRPLTE